MKKILFLLAVLIGLGANAQPYFINFAGDGLSSVKVENLSSGLIVTLNTGDVLQLTGTTNIFKVNSQNSSDIKIYPNPMTDKSTMEILPPLSGDVIISIFDMTGKTLTQLKRYLENFKYEFTLSGLEFGLYIVNIQGHGYQFSQKLLSKRISNGKVMSAQIIYNNFSTTVKKEIKNSKGFMANVDMAYNNGERLKYTAVSGNNRTVLTDIPSSNKTVTFTFIECKDGQDNYYPVVQINTQLWMAENLKTTTYRNGVSIGTTSPFDKDISGESTPSYQWAYDGNETNVAIYGRLYTWYAVTDNRNLCPTGWHIPTDAEWSTLENNLIENGYNYDGTTTINKVAKALASTSLWQSNTGNGTVGNIDYPFIRNAVGFSGLPGGDRNVNGVFGFSGIYGNWWSSTENSLNIPCAWLRYMDYSQTKTYREDGSKQLGYSVRCLRD